MGRHGQIQARIDQGLSSTHASAKPLETTKPRQEQNVAKLKVGKPRVGRSTKVDAIAPPKASAREAPVALLRKVAKTKGTAKIATATDSAMEPSEPKPKTGGDPAARRGNLRKFRQTALNFQKPTRQRNLIAKQTFINYAKSSMETVVPLLKVLGCMGQTKLRRSQLGFAAIQKLTEHTLIRVAHEANLIAAANRRISVRPSDLTSACIQYIRSLPVLYVP